MIFPSLLLYCYLRLYGYILIPFSLTSTCADTISDKIRSERADLDINIGIKKFRYFESKSWSRKVVGDCFYFIVINITKSYRNFFICLVFKNKII